MRVRTRLPSGQRGQGRHSYLSGNSRVRGESDSSNPKPLEVVAVSSNDPNTPSPPVPGAEPSIASTLVGILLFLAVVAAIVVLAVRYFTGAGDRSVEAYCQTWKAEGEQLHSRWAMSQRQAQSSGDPFGALSTVMGAPTDLADFFDKLDAVAPTDIEPAVARYRDAWRQTADNLGGKASDPLSFLMAQLMVSAQSAGAEGQIDSWTKSHCTAASTS
jgi:hypothetical protein